MYKIIASCISHCGMVREMNEDNLYFDGKFLEEKHRGLEKAVTIHRDTSQLRSFAVYDGMGGEKDGEVASYLAAVQFRQEMGRQDRKSTRLNSSHVSISYAVFCLKKKKKERS